MRNIKWIIIAVMAFISAIVITNRQKGPLPSYDAVPETPAPVAETQTSPALQGSVYTDDVTGLSLYIPDGWQYVLKNGIATFAHKASASWVQIKTEDYRPEITSVNADAFGVEVQAAGGSLISLEWFDNSSYMAKYVMPSASGYADHIEAVMFDRRHIVTISYILDDEFYDRLAKDIDYSLSSVSWNRQDPLPPTLYLEYSSYGNFEFGIPYNWDGGYADGAYYARENTTGASYSVTVTEGGSSYEAVTQEQYTDFVSAGREGFELESYVNDGSVTIAQGSYWRNGLRMLFRQCLLATDSFEYTMTQECPAAGYEAVAQVFDDLMNVFRVF